MFRLGSSVLCVAALSASPAHKNSARQPVLGTRTDAILTMDGLRFKDLNHNGRLDPYEDWRLTPEARIADLLKRLSLEEASGMLVHGSLQDAGFYRQPGASPAPDERAAYNFDRARQWILSQHVSSFVTRLNGGPEEMASANNRIQEIAESSPFGIPVTISADPKRHHLNLMLESSERDRAFSLWPEPLGFAAIGDAELTRRFGDTVRREYLAVGIRESLAPQADLATEPRWTRIGGTFGEDAALAARMVGAYVAGVQGGTGGLGPHSVISVVKHWAGYGAAKDGWDSHNYYDAFRALSRASFRTISNLIKEPSRRMWAESCRATPCVAEFNERRYSNVPMKSHYSFR